MLGATAQGVNEAAESSLQRKPTPGSSEASAKGTVRWLISAGGPELMAVSGATVSTVQMRTAGVGSTLAAWSTERTSKRCGPSWSGPMVTALVQGAYTPASASCPHSKA